MRDCHILGSLISNDGEVVSPAPFTLQEYFWYSFLLGGSVEFLACHIFWFQSWKLVYYVSVEAIVLKEVVLES